MSEAPKKLFTKNLLERVLSALALIPVVLGAVYVGEWAFLTLILLAVTVGMSEYMPLVAPKLSLRGKIWGYVAIIFVVSVGVFKGMPHALALSIPAALLLGYYPGCSGEKEERSRLRLWGALAIPYLAWSGLAMIHLRNIPEHGLGLIVYLLLVVWGTDTGAYFAGRIIGGPKLLPSVSPKKTWAGLIGGMAFAALFGYCVSLGFDESRVVPAAIIGAGLAVVSQAGDFFESFLKRRAGVKDSGTLIPGHGGILDRVDGLLFAALFLALIVQFGL